MAKRIQGNATSPKRAELLSASLRREQRRPGIRKIRNRLIEPEKTRQYKGLMGSVLRGEREFIDFLVEKRLSPFVSEVHSFADTRTQAFICSMTAKNPEERRKMAFTTFVMHYLDDFFDSPNRRPSLREMTEKRMDIKGLLASMGKRGEIAGATAKMAVHPESFYRAIQRVLYGGIISQQTSQPVRDSLMAEYKRLSLEKVGPITRKGLEKIPANVYWLTSKTVMECFAAFEEKFNPTVAELWSVLYSPALFLHDFKREMAAQELSLSRKELPMTRQLTSMIDIAAKHLQIIPDERKKLRINQLEAVLRLFGPVLPKEISGAYKKALQTLS